MRSTLAFTLGFAGSAASQVLLSCPVPGDRPLRFGVPLPAADLTRGLRVTGAPGVALQWRPLQREPDRENGRVWVQLCLCRVDGRPAVGEGRVRIRAGGVGACGREGGAAAAREVAVVTVDGRREETERWRWRDGTLEVVRRIGFEATQEYGGETFGAGEGWTEGVVAERFTRAGLSPGFWRSAGVLPGRGDLGRRYRRRLLELVARLEELPGLRDRGDYRRSRGVMTNLEFDTTLAFARLGLSEGRPELLARALRSAVHSVDRDLDARTGLLFRHGRGHRSGPPEPGHTWLAGVLLVGCVAGDPWLIDGARRIARGLASHPALGEGRAELVRDVGWPLLEMETWLRFEADREVAAACGGIVEGVLRRFDRGLGVFRFGEGERRNGVYEAPLWVSAGSLLPGLRAFLGRTGDRRVAEVLRLAERRLSGLARSGKAGIPVRAWMARGEVFQVARIAGAPSGFLVLEGLGAKELLRCLQRSQVRDALEEVPAYDDPDLVTSLSIVGRCSWIYR